MFDSAGFAKNSKDTRCGLLEEIGDDIGVTRDRVRQISLRAIRRLRHKSHPGKLEQHYKGLENG